MKVNILPLNRPRPVFSVYAGLLKKQSLCTGVLISP